MEARTRVVKAELANGAKIQIQATSLGGEEAVVWTPPSFSQVTDAIEGIAESLMKTLKNVKPSKATVEFGIEVGIESGQLTTLLVKGTGNSNLKITLEWDTESSQESSSGKS